MLHLAHFWLSILIHRPFYRRSRNLPSEKDADHVKVNLKAAPQITVITDVIEESAM
jgi:hypothetical protein